jgi:hypothetical protein
MRGSYDGISHMLYLQIRYILPLNQIDHTFITGIYFLEKSVGCGPKSRNGQYNYWVWNYSLLSIKSRKVVEKENLHKPI